MEGKKRKWFVQGSRLTTYESVVIEASSEEVAIVEYRCAVESGIVNIESMSELDVDSGEDWDEGVGVGVGVVADE